MKIILSMLLTLVLVASLGVVVSPGLANAATQAVSPTTWYVAEGGAGAEDGANWTNAFATIQDAIDRAVSGDTIMVAAGKYDAFTVETKTNVGIIGAEGATVATTNLYTDLPVVGNAWVLAAVYDSQNINIKGINFDGAGGSGKPVVVGIAYVDSTGSIANLTVEHVRATQLGAGVAIIGNVDISTVEITGATISDNGNAGIYVCGGSGLEAHFNEIIDNTQCGLLSDGGGTVDATYNWWGDVSGPLHQTNPLGKGNAVAGDVNFKPWLGAAPATVKTETVTNGTVDAKLEADTEVAVDGTATVIISKLVVKGTATTTIAEYASNLYLTTSHDLVGYAAPASLDFVALSDEFKQLNMFRDVRVINTTPGTAIEIRLYYTDAEVAGFNETTLRLFWWNGTAWVQCSDGDVNTADTEGYNGYMWARVTATTAPSLTQLGGTPWGGYGHPTEAPFCFIATAAYGDDTAKAVGTLREFRDTVLLQNSLGTGFVSLYYEISPPIASFIYQHEALRTLVRVGFVDLIVAILDWSHDLWS